MSSPINTPPLPRLRSLCQLSVLIALVAGSTIVHAQSTRFTLDEALRLSLQHSPITRAASASVQASQETAVKADQLPDPTLRLGIENLPVDGRERWSTTRDFMTMRRVGIEQQWVSAEKRAARAERAQREVEMEQGNYLDNVAKVRMETARAWVNVLYGQRALSLIRSIEMETTEDLAAVQAAYRGARATAADLVQARSARLQAQDATRKSEQDLRHARLVLNRWTSVPNATVADETPSLNSRVPDLGVEDLEKYHPLVLGARRAINLADAETTSATRERRPDWTIEAGVGHRSRFSNMVSLGISIPLAVNPSKKQDRDIAEKSALGTKARLQYENALREAQTEIQSLSTTIESIKERLALLTAGLLPSAAQQAELATAAYRAGAGSLSAVFNARRALVERQLEVLELEKEAALSWAQLEHRVVPHALASTGRAEQ